MKKYALVVGLAVATLSLGVPPAAAQFGGISGALNTASKVTKVADLKVTDAEERQIGQLVSDKMVETFGVFQLESGGMTRYVQELRPTSIKDLAAMVALYRPGPMQHIPTFAAA